MRIILVAVALLLLAGCATTKPIEVSTVAVEKAPLILPAVDQYQQRNVEWTIITEENATEKFNQLRAQGKAVVFFAVTATGYEELGLNFADILKIIKQQKAIIAAYDDYYTPPEPEEEPTEEEPERSLFEDLF